MSNITSSPLASILLVLLPAACADEGSDVHSSVFASEIQTLVFEIDAMAGAEPEGATPSAIAEPWELLEVNMTALFEGSPRELMLPG